MNQCPTGRLSIVQYYEIIPKIRKSAFRNITGRSENFLRSHFRHTIVLDKKKRIAKHI